MHPHMIYLYIKAVDEQREREAEHARLVASIIRSRRQRQLTKKPRRLTKNPRRFIRFPHLHKNGNRDEIHERPTLEMNSQR